MKDTDRDFLEATLRHKKMLLEGLRIDHRVALGVYEAETKLLNNDIDLIERQLEGRSDT